MNRNAHEQLFSLSSRQGLSSLAHVIGPLSPRCGTSWTCGGEKGWVIYHNNQRLRHHKVSVHQGDFFACYERCDSAAPFQADRPVTDVTQGWVAHAPTLVPSEAAGSPTLVPSVGDAAGGAQNDASPTFENTGDPLLLIGRGSGRRRRDDRIVSFELDSFQ